MFQLASTTAAATFTFKATTIELHLPTAHVQSALGTNMRQAMLLRPAVRYAGRGS